MTNVFGGVIHNKVSRFLETLLKDVLDFTIANDRIFDRAGIKDFFQNQEDFLSAKNTISGDHHAEKIDRTEYGDFQTNGTLALSIAEHLRSNRANPEIVIEPTCGKGAFILAALRSFTEVKKIFAIEIHKPYVWEAKFNILEFAIDHPARARPEITIYHSNIFDFDFTGIASQCFSKEILVIGNPPWVTSSQLGTLESVNLPAKSNFKNHSGLDAITGKGNFDIGEHITLMMLQSFENVNGQLALLVKNSVVKNIVFHQKQRAYKISEVRKYNIDSKREFNASVEASLFTCKLNTQSESNCGEFDFYHHKNPIRAFGWVGDKFVSNVEHYESTREIDGICQFEWRQGVKHDCSAVMELDRINGYFTNARADKIHLEEGLVYGMLKSSDLKDAVISKTRKYTIITQKKIGQETRYIKDEFPRTYEYLLANISRFEIRKSGIYRNKPPFSIFGIGDYSFKPYKVSISGLYKNISFNLILPQHDKPIMLDDTCYFLGFDSLEFAAYTLILLNSKTSKAFLQSITFPDAKRTFTKDILMRVDLLKLSQIVPQDNLFAAIDFLRTNYGINVETKNWKEYTRSFESSILQP
jgi:hypothetical protein